MRNGLFHPGFLEVKVIFDLASDAGFDMSVAPQIGERLAFNREERVDER